MEYVDLHSHSRASDGTYTPSEVVRAAREAGLVGLALTDHDTVAGCDEAAEEARRVGVRFLPGIEVSAEFPRPGTLHLLGYGVDPQSKVLHELTRRLVEGRTTRNGKMVAAMHAEGFNVTIEELEAEAGGGTVGRPHLAAILLRKGYVSSRQEAFDKYLGQGGKFYVDKEVTTSRQAIEMVHAAGGVVVLAHPTQLRTENDAHLETVVKGLVDQGLDGIEIYHSDFNEADSEKFARLAKRYALVVSGGSDFHGGAKPSIMLGRAGKQRVPASVMDGVEAAIAKRKGT